MFRRTHWLVLVVGLWSGIAWAGEGSGHVTQLMVHENDILIFRLASKAGSPACGHNDQWAVSLASHKGRAMYAMLLSAQARSAPVHVQGAGDCNDWGDRERPLYMWQ